ncbi:OB-fold protein [Psychroflexus sp. MBR-150]|jgi:predicted Holliday junction resolvase-like endonuclease
MSKKKVIKKILLVVLGLVIIIGIVAVIIIYQPHRDVQSAKTDYALKASDIVQEYLKDNEAANEKYLAADGESKVLEIEGQVSEVSEDFNGNTVILLKSDTAKAGVQASFTEETSAEAKQVKQGSTITIKGVIRSGASFDEDLEMYENVIVEKSKVIKK